MPALDGHGRTIGVDRLAPGDHAILSCADDDDRWNILTVFTRQGFARDEKVFLHVDVGHSPAVVAARVCGGQRAARQALRTRQLVVSNTPRFARGEFDAGRLVEGARRRIDTVLAEGFSGLRSASETSLALAPVDHLDQAVEYETALHSALFGGECNRHYTAVCYWDERVFGGTAALRAAHAAHPVALLSRLGALHVELTSDGVSLAGESDLANRAQFDAALGKLGSLDQDTLVLDITDLSFLDAHSAGAVLRLAARLVPPRRLEVRCRSVHRKLLQLLDGRSVRQLSIITERL